MAKDLQSKVEALGNDMARQLGENLRAFCLYGPAVRHDVPDPEASTLLILRDASPSALRPVEQTIAAWTKKGHPPPLIFAEGGWNGAADVFPIEMEDMREAHVVIQGSSPFDGVTTTREDLRRELEREVRSKLLRLRTEFVAAAADAKALERLLVDSAGTFFTLFRATLRLTGTKPPQEREPLVRETAAATGMDGEAFGWILSRIAGRKTAKLTAHDAVGDRYVEQIEKLAHFIDTFGDAVPAKEG